METKMIRMPFNIETAKKITNKEVEGIIVTRNGESVRIVCFNRKDEFRPIIALINSGDIEVHYAFSLNGKFVNDDVLDTHDLMLEIPEYMTFKDGDVIAYDNVKDVFFIIGSKCSMTDENPNYHAKYEKGYITFGTEDSFCRLKGSRLATEEEKQKLIDALKASDNPRAKECLKKLGIEVKQECEFKFRDLVLVRSSNKDKWCAAEFSNKDGKWYAVFGGLYYEQCIPYNEQTAHLLGTTENYE